MLLWELCEYHSTQYAATVLWCNCDNTCQSANDVRILSDFVYLHQFPAFRNMINKYVFLNARWQLFYYSFIVLLALPSFNSCLSSWRIWCVSESCMTEVGVAPSSVVPCRLLHQKCTGVVTCGCCSTALDAPAFCNLHGARRYNRASVAAVSQRWVKSWSNTGRQLKLLFCHTKDCTHSRSYQRS